METLTTQTIKAPASPLVLLSKITFLSIHTPKIDAIEWRKQVEGFYNAHFGHTEWTYKDVHPIDCAAMVELDALIEGKLDADIICEFNSLNWRTKIAEAQLQSNPRIKVESGVALVLYAAHFFKDPAFVEWLKNPQPKFTWTKNGCIDEWSDVVVLVEPALTGEGSDSDMPEHIWDQIINICRTNTPPGGFGNTHIHVRLVNM